jgi:hypothetical protein
MQPLFGWALDLGWTGAIADGVRIYGISEYRSGLWLMFALALLALVASVTLKETHCRQTT